MTRHVTWCRFEFVGDIHVCQRYMNEGRQYLGALEEEMKHGVIPSNARRVTNAVGVVFSVIVAMGVPIVRIDATALAPTTPMYGAIEGIVMKPTDAGAAFTPNAHDEIVWQSITSASTTVNITWVFDGQHLDPTLHNHVTPPAPSVYKPIFPDKVTGPTDPGGLSLFGNVDWRNADESLHVTWYGPRSRYFPERDLITTTAMGSTIKTRQPYVFYKGRVLFNCADFELALTGNTGLIVSGACITARVAAGVSTTYLVVVASNIVSVLGSTDPTNQDYVITARLAADGVKFVVDTTSVRLAGSRLWQQSSSSYDRDSMHPFFFNSDGTEARCIRGGWNTSLDATYEPDTNREIVIGLSDITTATFTVTETLLPLTTATVTETGTRGYMQTLVPRLTLVITYTSSGPSTPSTFSVRTDSNYDVIGVAVGSGRGTPVSAPVDSVVTTTTMRPAFVVAVDYRGNVPVYASSAATSNIVADHNVYAYTGSCTPSLVVNNVVNGTYHPGDPHDTYFSRANYTVGLTEAESTTRTLVRTVTTSGQGISTDFFSYQVSSSASYSLSASFSESISGAVTGYIYDDTSGDIFSEMPNLGGQVVVSVPYLVSVSGTPSALFSTSGNISVSITGETALNILHLDLRTKTIAYFVDRISSYTGSSAWSFSSDLGYTFTAGNRALAQTGAFATNLPAYYISPGQTNLVVPNLGWSGSTSNTPAVADNTTISNLVQPAVTVTLPVITTNTAHAAGFGLPSTYWVGSIFADLDWYMGVVYQYSGTTPLYTTVPPLATVAPSDPHYVAPAVPLNSVPAPWTVNTTSTSSYRRSYFNAAFNVVGWRIVDDGLIGYAKPDNMNFLWIGGWETYKGQWAYSSIAPATANYADGTTSGSSAGGIPALIGAPAYDKVFWPMTIVTKTNFKV